MTAAPYIGPRPFEREDLLFGRDREIRELLYVLIAERIVVLHSPSGAGKTSLLQAGLLPRLEEEDFSVWPLVRVSRAAPESANRYVYSTLLNWESELPESRRRSEEELTQLSLLEYVQSRPRRKNAPESTLLTFDQFEEILTIDSLALEEKREFFRQLGELLQEPKFWALFAIRDDYLAGLTPYSNYLPTQLNTRFHLDLLSLDAARDAIAHPAEQAGRSFQPQALQRLVDDLATVSLQQADGSFAQAVGNYVEPVQLQVVCLRLWQQLTDEVTQIDLEHLQASGNVSEALQAYYDEQIHQLAARACELVQDTSEDTPQDAQDWERSLREWFDDHLIINRIRGQVLREPQRSGDLHNVLIEHLVNAHLVRAEKRAGATWYELSHDRLIEPVEHSNTTWFKAHLQYFQRHAQTWDRQGRPDSLLLQGDVLCQAEEWAKRYPQRLRDTETALLDRSRTLRRRKHWKQSFAIFAFIAALVVIAVTNFYLQRAIKAEQAAEQEKWKAEAAAKEADLERQKAEKSKEEAEAERNRALRTQAQFLSDLSQQEVQRGDAVTAMLLALEALKNSNGLTPPVHEAERSLYQALMQQRETRILNGHPQAVEQVLFNQLGTWVLTVSGQQMYLWDINNLNKGTPAHVLQAHQGKVEQVLFSPNGALLASTAADYTLRLWKMPDGTAGPVIDTRFCQADLPEQCGLTRVAFTEDSEKIWGAAYNGHLYCWRVRDGALIQDIPAYPDSGITELQLSADGSQALTLNDTDAVSVWNLKEAQLNKYLTAPNTVSMKTGPITHAIFSPNSKYIIAAQDVHGSVYIWNAESGLLQHTIDFGEEGLNNLQALKLSPDGKYLLLLAAGDAELWALDSNELPKKVNFAQVGKIDVDQAYFSTEKNLLALISADSADVQIWHLVGGEAEFMFNLHGHHAAIKHAQFSPDGNWLLTASDDHTARLWNLGQALDQPSYASQQSFSDIRYSPNGHWLATTNYEQGQVQLWDAQSLRLLTTLPMPEDSFNSSKYGYEMRLLFSPNQQWLLSLPNLDDQGDYHGLSDSLLWRLSDDLQTPAAYAYLPVEEYEVLDAVFTPNGRWLILSVMDQPLQLCDLQTPPYLVKDAPEFATEADAAQVWPQLSCVDLEHELRPQALPRGLSLSPDGHYLVALMSGQVAAWDLNPLNQQPLDLPTLVYSMQTQDVLLSLAFSPDSQYFATTDTAAEVLLWSVKTGEIVRRFDTYQSNIAFTRFSPDGKWLAGNAEDGSVRIWDIEQTDPKHLLTVKAWEILFSPDSQQLATQTQGQGVQLWDIHSGQLLQKLADSRGENAIAIDFSPNGAWLAVATNSSLRLWPIFASQDDLSQQARSRLLRKLTPEQKQRYFLELTPEESFRMYQSAAQNYLEQSSYQAAYLDWQKALQALEGDIDEPDQGYQLQAYYGLAKTYLGLKNGAAALEALQHIAPEQCAKISESNPCPLLSKQAAAYMLMADFAHAVETYRAALEQCETLDSGCLDLLWQQAQAEANNNDAAAAQASYQRILEASDGKEAEQLQRRAKVYEQLALLNTAQPQQAQQYWQQAYENIYTLAQYYSQHKAWQQAADAWSRAQRFYQHQAQTDAKHLMQLAEAEADALYKAKARTNSVVQVYTLAREHARNAGITPVGLLYKLARAKGGKTAYQQLLSEFANVDCRSAAELDSCYYLTMAALTLSSYAPEQTANGFSKTSLLQQAMNWASQLQQHGYLPDDLLQQLPQKSRQLAELLQNSDRNAALSVLRQALSFVRLAVHRFPYDLELRKQAADIWEITGIFLIQHPEVALDIGWENLYALKLPINLLGLSERNAPWRYFLNQVQTNLQQNLLTQPRLSEDQIFEDGMEALEQAEKIREALLEIMPNNLDLYIDLGQLYLKMGESGLQSATQLAERYAELKVLDKQAFWLALGDRLAEDNGFTDEALLVYEHYASLMREQDNWAQVAAAYRAQLELDAEQDSLHMRLGEALAQQALWDEAIAQYRIVQQNNPQHEEAWHQECLAELAQEKYAEAETACRQQVTVTPKHTQAWYRLAQALEKQEKYTEALAMLRQQLKVNPEHKNAWLRIGQLQQQMGQLEEAESSYEKQLQVRPEHGQARYYLKSLKRPELEQRRAPPMQLQQLQQD